ncbi:MAG: hypothetical protein J6X30_01170 [Clostridia bacterium]|nr:hypothetical protein [Clostridia bacterium]
MKRLYRFFAAALVVLLLSGCVSGTEKSLVRGTVKAYFNALQTQDFATANALTVACEENIPASIDASPVNVQIFGGIAYELWGINKQGGVLYAHLMITQISLAKAYENTAREYDAFMQDAYANNRVYTDEAKEIKWNEIFYRHVQGTEETAVFEVDVPLTEQDGYWRLNMTASFRNALFGGELDAIRALESIQKGEETP